MKNRCFIARSVATFFGITFLLLSPVSSRASDTISTPIRTFGYGPLVCSVLSPDGKTYATGNGNFKAYLFDASSGAFIRWFQSNSWEVLCLAFSPDGSKLVGGGYDSAAVVWNVATATVLFRLMGHLDRINGVAVSKDGSTIATASADRTVRLWNAATGAYIRTLTGHLGEVLSVCFSPDGSKICTGSSDSTARIWNTATGAPVRTLTIPVGVPSVDYSPDGTKLLTGSQQGDTLAREWEASTGALLRTYGRNSYGASIVLYSPDGTKVLSSSLGGNYSIFDEATGALIGPFWDASHLVSASFSPDGKQITGAFANNSVHTIDITNGTTVHDFAGFVNWVGTVAFSPDGSKLLGAGYLWHYTNMATWDVNTGAILHEYAASGSFDGAAIPIDGSTIFASTYTPALYDFNSGAFIRSMSGFSGSSLCAAISPDGSKAAVGAFDSTAKLWESSTGTLIRTFRGHTYWVNGLAFSPDGSTLATASGDRTIKLWNVNTGELIRTFTGHTADVECVVFFPAGDKIITGSADRTAKLWDVNTGTLLKTFYAPGSWVSTISLSPDATKMATAGFWGTETNIWDINTAKVIRTYNGNTDFVFSVTWSRDGKRIATGSRTGPAMVWDASGLVGNLPGKQKSRRSVYSARFVSGTTLVVSGRAIAGMLTLYAITGKRIATHQIPFGVQTAVFSLPPSIAAGTYFCQIKNDSEIWNGSLILEK